MADIPRPAYANNMRAIGHSDQGGRPDAVQVMVNKGHAFVSHLFSNGFSVIDVREGRLTIGRDTIRDAHRIKELTTLEQVVQRSSNIGTAKIALSLPPELEMCRSPIKGNTTFCQMYSSGKCATSFSGGAKRTTSSCENWAFSSRLASMMEARIAGGSEVVNRETLRAFTSSLAFRSL